MVIHVRYDNRHENRRDVGRAELLVPVHIREQLIVKPQVRVDEVEMSRRRESTRQDVVLTRASASRTLMNACRVTPSLRAS